MSYLIMKTSIIGFIVLVGLTVSISLSAPPPIKLQSFTLSRSEVPGGIDVSGTLTLTKGPPKQGIIVMIQSIDPAIATVPTVVEFAQGETIKQFTMRGVPRCDSIQINITCTLGISLTQSLIIRRPAFTIMLEPNPVIGGSPVMGTIVLDGPAPNCP